MGGVYLLPEPPKKSGSRMGWLGGVKGLLLVPEISHFSFNYFLPTNGGEFCNIVEWRNMCVCERERVSLDLIVLTHSVEKGRSQT